jgi:hypothetical protein
MGVKQQKLYAKESKTKEFCSSRDETWTFKMLKLHKNISIKLI